MQLYETYFNTLSKHVLERRMMQYSEKYGMHGHQLYDSRKGISTYNGLVAVHVIYDMARAQRDYQLSIFNDLKWCYDSAWPALTTASTRKI